MRVRLVVLAVAVLAGAAPAAPARAQTAPVQVTVTGRVQVQWNSTSVTADEAGSQVPIASHTFETRRVRLGARIRASDAVDGFLETDVALGRLQLKQAWMRVALDQSLSVRAGQFKKPFGLVELTSSAQLPIIERGVRIRGLTDVLAAQADGRLGTLRGGLLLGEAYALVDAVGYAGYDLGVAVEGSHGRLAWSAGAFNGNGPDARDENDGKSVAARAVYAADIGLPIAFGAGWSRREMNWPLATSPETRAGNAFGMDAELGGFRSGWWVLADATLGDNLLTDETFVAAQGVLSHFRATGGGPIEGVEAVGRMSWADPDRSVDGDAGMLLTPGVNLYFTGRNRVMFNWDVYVPEGSGMMTQHAARAQANLYF
ncbi:hypothetical protein BH23GEM10_BH23GEM10_04060 [soil metagenome]